MKNKIALTAYCTLLWSLSCLATNSVFWANLPPCPYAVGFEILQLPNAASDGKPLQISVWYPAKTAGGQLMSYSNYFLLSTTEEGNRPDKSDQGISVQKYQKELVSNGVPQNAIDQWFRMQMAATMNAQPSGGRFPLVIVVQGNFQTTHDQAILSEYIAANGYIVVTSPSPTRVLPMKSEDDVVPMAKRQAAEMKSLLARLKEDPRVESNYVGLVAHSFGARSALLFAANESTVKAFVSLDGGIGAKMGKEWIDKVSDFDREQFTAPLLHFYETVDDFMSPDFDLLKSLHRSNRYLIKVENIHHYQFSSFGIASGVVPHLSENQQAIKRKCDAILRYTVQFLGAFLKNDHGARTFVEATPQANGFSLQDLSSTQIWKSN